MDQHRGLITFPFRSVPAEMCTWQLHRAFHHSPYSMSSSPSSPSAWMSYWDRYFAPGDLRTRREIQSIATPGAKPTSSSDNGTPDTITPTPGTQQQQQQHLYDVPAPLTPDHRARRQNALFLGGLTFTLLSLSLTRRTILRKRTLAYPALFTPSHMHIAPPPGPQQQMSKVEGSLLAIEALGLATLNVVSVFMVGIGGMMVWWDVAEPADLRRSVGEGGLGGVVEVDEEVEREVEGWIAGAFGGGPGSGQQEGNGNEGGEGVVNGSIGALGGEAFRQGVLDKLEAIKKEKEGQEGNENGKR